jgi:hypothetical protein
VVIVLTAPDLDNVVAAFEGRYYISKAAVLDAILRNSMFNVLDFSSGLKADFWVTACDPFNSSLLQRRRRVEIVAGREAFVGSAEDVLLHKLVWNTISPSERQLADAAGIAAVQAGNLDLDYLRQWAKTQGTEQVLEEVLAGRHLKRN